MLHILTFNVCKVKFCVSQINNLCVNFVSQQLVFTSTVLYRILEGGGGCPVYNGELFYVTIEGRYRGMHMPYVILYFIFIT
jgi:hypothetical protein